MNVARLASMFLLPALASQIAAADDRILFRFDRPEDGRFWQTVNDGVMGGRSTGRFRISQNGNLQFYGSLSLANNGGFASVRARGRSLGLRSGDSVVVKVRGDGRQYNFDLYANGYSFRQTFKTIPGQWIEVTFPSGKYVATWRGNRYPNKRLDPEQVTGLGFLLGDKKSGSFQLDVESIAVRR